MKRQTFAGSLLLVSLALCAPAAHADGRANLAEVQKAYADVDYEATRSLATAAIKRGGNDRSVTSQLYLLWATAAAALDHADEARDTFALALALDPELKLDRNLSPKIRAPYQEARGSLAMSDGKPPLEVTLERHHGALALELHDSLHVARSIELATRARDGEPFARRRVNAAPSQQLPTPSAAELQFCLRVLDGYGNVLLEQGTEDAPRRLVLVGSSRPATAPGASATDRNPTPYYITAGVLGVLGLTSAGVATAMYVRREDDARTWNGAGCEHPGATRQQQCSDVDSHRQRAENMAIGFGAAGGALLLSGVISFVLAPSRTSPAAVAVDSSPHDVMLRFRTSL